MLRLFLIADLLAAATILPVVLGVWHRARPGAALVGGLAGLGAVVVLGRVTRGSLLEGVRLLTLPETLDLGAFVVAPLAPGLLTWAGSAPTGPRGDGRLIAGSPI